MKALDPPPADSQNNHTVVMQGHACPDNQPNCDVVIPWWCTHETLGGKIP